nr:calcium permeable stress-gated cation channel 1 [Quercus suber]
MKDFGIFAKDGDDGGKGVSGLYGTRIPQRDVTIQIILSLALGVSAFAAFCILRPRWTGLYAARKMTKDEATGLPELPTSMFGWMVPLWKITDQQVLASAGLDAYVFLAFFKLAVKFLLVTFFFSLVVIKPVHDTFDENGDDGKNGTKHGNKTRHDDVGRSVQLFDPMASNHTGNGTTGLPFYMTWETDFLWMYIVFAYLFSGIALYLMISETRRIIEIRQEYLGTQTTITDRTIRLSGIPTDLQDEDRIKEFIESLDIGKVETVSLCRDWKELDEAMVARMDTLRRLEEAYTIYQGSRRPVELNGTVSRGAQPHVLISTDDEEQDQGERLLSESADTLVNGQAIGTPFVHARPTTTIRFGKFLLRSKRVDAIDYYEEALRQADQRVTELRQKEFAPTRLAFITMDSVAACQMAIQAVLDPSPLQLIASQSPAPSDVIWPNTYLSRRSRVLRSWTITGLIVFLTLFWSVLVLLPTAALLTPETISWVLPQLGSFLEAHENIKSLVRTQLPTLIVSLLNVLVPYLYYWLSWYQGMASQGDIELSTISKNFFFTFFNFFVVFMFLGTASKFYQLFDEFGEVLKDFKSIGTTLAKSLGDQINFYVNFIILQGVGLFPFRLLEIGSVFLYPIYRLGAKTPRGKISSPFTCEQHDKY